ncbi:DNA recombination protein RmuC [Naumannella halotolerans]|uniref:DNA recombination protein RmuC n=1 Tax=Naumannella halotolerans TaxID=993414 RepID=A0A4R7J5K2_9ACTN|nr:DNA recombination protein RmuC [Naumannella halotolerans]TDT32632.1 DNA recombination protein RmuC [Naumannella halotolerans]
MDIATGVLMLLIGLALGAVGAWLVLRSRQQAELVGAAGADRADAAQREAELAQFRSEAAQARAEAAAAREQLAGGKAAISDARAEAANAQAEAAAVGAELAKAVAERDAARDRVERLAADRESLVLQFKALSAESLANQGKQADARADERLKATEQALKPVTETLALFQARLTAVEKERVALATDLRNQVQAVQATGEHLRRETHALATALRKPHLRGAWGELQLKRVAEVAGMVEHCDFNTQHTTSADDRAVRPDMRVAMGDGKCIFVDAKVPLAAFLDAHEADDEREHEEALNRFAGNVRTHIDQLSGKRYWQAEEGTPEFVIMFLPSESLGAQALAQAPDLHEYAAARNVVLATPTTLIATLRAVAYGWKQAALAESAADVFRLGRELHERIGTMGGHFDRLGRALDRTVAQYNSTVSSLETRVLVSARRFTELHVSDVDLATATPVETPIRRVSQTELVEDAAQVTPVIEPVEQESDTAAKSRASLPEAGELRRRDPDLFELLADQVETEGPDRQHGVG